VFIIIMQQTTATPTTSTTTSATTSTLPVTTAATTTASAATTMLAATTTTTTMTTKGDEVIASRCRGICHEVSLSVTYLAAFFFEQPILHSLWGSWRVSLVITPLNLNGSQQNQEYKCRVTVLIHTNNVGGIAPGLLPKVAKMYMYFSVVQLQPTLHFGHLSCTDFDHIAAEDVSQCLHAYTDEKFPNFCAGVFQALKLAKQSQNMTIQDIKLCRHCVTCRK